MHVTADPFCGEFFGKRIEKSPEKPCSLIIGRVLPEAVAGGPVSFPLRHFQAEIRIAGGTVGVGDRFGGGFHLSRIVPSLRASDLMAIAALHGHPSMSSRIQYRQGDG